MPPMGLRGRAVFWLYPERVIVACGLRFRGQDPILLAPKSEHSVGVLEFEVEPTGIVFYLIGEARERLRAGMGVPLAGTWSVPSRGAETPAHLWIGRQRAECVLFAYPTPTHPRHDWTGVIALASDAPALTAARNAWAMRTTPHQADMNPPMRLPWLRRILGTP